MLNALLVFFGGGLGALARWGVGLAATRLLGAGWPWGTLIVNVAGGLAMGVLAAVLARSGGAAADGWRLLLGVGVLGGFTTFSAFSLETARMIEGGRWVEAGAYALLSVVLSVAALFAGLALGRGSG
jgi:fluoride exporter